MFKTSKTKASLSNQDQFKMPLPQTNETENKNEGGDAHVTGKFDQRSVGV